MTIDIKTKRLHLRTPTLDDAAEIHAEKIKVWHDLQSWMSWATDDSKGIEALITQFIEPAEVQYHVTGFCLETGRFVVCSGATDQGDGVFEVGYWVTQDFRGRGLATEAAQAMIDYAFETLHAKRVYICHYEGNEGSRRVIEKLGFKKTGVVCSAHKRFTDGVAMDKHEYVMTRDDWAR